MCLYICSNLLYNFFCNTIQHPWHFMAWRVVLGVILPAKMVSSVTPAPIVTWIMNGGDWKPQLAKFWVPVLSKDAAIEPWISCIWRSLPLAPLDAVGGCKGRRKGGGWDMVAMNKNPLDSFFISQVAVKTSATTMTSAPNSCDNILE